MMYETLQESGWIEGDEQEERVPESAKGPRSEWGLDVHLAQVSVSLVSRAPPAELVHALFAGVELHAAAGLASHTFTLSVHTMQWDNQVLARTRTHSHALAHTRTHSPARLLHQWSIMNATENAISLISLNKQISLINCHISHLQLHYLKV